MAKKKRPAKTARQRKRPSSRQKPASAAAPRPATTATPAPTGNELSSGIVLNVLGLGLPTRQRPFLIEYFPTPEQAAAEAQVRARELQLQRQDAERALATVYDDWKARLAVSGQPAWINVAYRTKHGHIVAPLQFVIQVNVSSKLPKAVLPLKNWVEFPSSVDGVPVKVRQIQITSMGASIHATAGSSATAPPAAPASGIKGGAAITSTGASTEWGTLGICLPASSGPELFGITNFHVGGPSQSIVTTFSTPSQPLGTVQSSANTPFCDAASISPNPAATFLEGIMALPFSGPNYRFATNIDFKGVMSLNLATVAKVGAALPARVVGAITNLSADPIVQDLGPGQFHQVLEVHNAQTAFIQPGDSGSVLVYESDSGPIVIGLNFAGNDDGSTGYAFPFGQVLSNLQLSLPSARTVLLS